MHSIEMWFGVVIPSIQQAVCGWSLALALKAKAVLISDAINGTKNNKRGKEPSTYRNLTQKYRMSSLVAPLHRVNHVRFRLLRVF